MLNLLSALGAVILLILCMLAPLKKRIRRTEHPFLYQILSHHSGYAIAMLLLSLFHGILAGNKPGMLSGKIAWMLLLILIILAYPKQRTTHGIWRTIHLYAGMILCLLILFHIGYALLF